MDNSSIGENFKIMQYVLSATKDPTGHTVKGGRSPDAHKRPKRNVLNSCDLRSKYLNLFKVVTADISVVESYCGYV